MLFRSVSFSATDTFNSVVSQLRQATGVWNSVATSDLRVAFGGLENTATLQNTPGGDIVFEGSVDGLVVLADQPVVASGVAESHVTAAGVDVTGYCFYAFQSGVTLYSPVDLHLSAPAVG